MRVLYISPATANSPHLALAALEHLPHTIHHCTSDHGSLLRTPPCEVAIFDATVDLGQVAQIVHRLDVVGMDMPVIVVVTEGGLSAASPAWRTADIVLADAGVAEIDARLRLAAQRGQADDAEGGVRTVGGITVNEDSYTAAAGGRNIDLTYKEFELLKFFTQFPGRVFSRAQLLQDVWGYDYYGGTRTVDVHIRRLRAKLSPDLDSTIQTVRNVGYRFSPDPTEGDDDTSEHSHHAAEERMNEHI